MRRDDNWLYTILVCSVTGERLRLLEPDELDSVNTRIESGDALCRGGAVAGRPLDGGLLAGKSGFVYPIHDDLPYLLPEDAIEAPL